MKALVLLALAAFPAWASNSAWTLADFDGDRRLDIARLAVTEPAVLLPVDLDYDADLDLVLHESLTDRPLAVWLNDGHGHFTRDAAPRRIPRENHSRWQSASQPSAPLFDVPPAAELVAVLATSSVRPDPLSLPALRLPLARSLESAPARGPPPSHT